MTCCPRSAIKHAVLALSALCTLIGAAPSAIASGVEQQLMRDGVPGAAVAIVRDGRIVYSGAFGKRALGGPKTDTATRFEIGSLTKQFTAAAILQLKERGKLRLDDPLSSYLPGFPHANEISIRQLLNQTSGLPDFMMVNHFLAISHSSPGSFEKIESLVRGPLHFKPGSQWEYSNTNYIALGRVIEIVSRQPFDDYVQTRLFARARMRHSTTLARESQLANVATGYWRGLSMKGPLTPAPSTREDWTWSAGDIVSTAEDIARWDIALQSGKIVSAADFKLMTSPVRLSNGKLDDYGMHWWIDRVNGRRVFSGPGDTYGFSSCNDVFPDNRTAIIVLENTAVTSSGKFDAGAATAKAVASAIL